MNETPSIDLPSADFATASAHDVAARRVRDLALRALWQELLTYPKPGLVSPVDSGSHLDMDATTFARSAFSLRGYFRDMAAAGASGAPFESLRRLGVLSEARMLRATRGVNTHRGAIFNLGLLAAAAGHRTRSSSALDSACVGVECDALGDIVRRHWGPALAAHRRDPRSHGSRADTAHGAGGARVEAMAGFPSVYAIALPAYRAVLAGGGAANPARVQAGFALIAHLADTNLLHRGGAAGLAHAQRSAREFLNDGGVFQPGWLERATTVHRDFSARGLSPGGSADLLACCVFVDAIERGPADA